MSSYLITGGNGNTGRKIAADLTAAGHKPIIASRSGESSAGLAATKLSWEDESTYGNPFSAYPGIKAVYILIPTPSLTLDRFKKFVTTARDNGVKRFVQLSSADAPPITKQAEDYLKSLEKEGVEWTILKPSWFFENFKLIYVYTINSTDSFNTATGTGKVGLISAEDIATEGFKALTSEKPINAPRYIFGPELLSYDEAAQILSDVVGRKITHVQINRDTALSILTSVGVEEKTAGYLVDMEVDISNGAEQKLIDANEGNVVRGKTTLKEFFEKNKAVWSK